LIADNSHIDFLIAKYLAGNISREEQAELDAWIISSSPNSKYFSDVRYIYYKSQASCKYIQVDTGKAWKMLHKGMHPENVHAGRLKTGNISRRWWIATAASVAILLGIAYIFQNYRTLNRAAGICTIVTSDSAVAEKLPDNTLVTLNKNSKVRYSYNKLKRQKELELTGEAFIEVTHGIDTPLVVIAGKTFIKDIGTSFNVKAYEKLNNIDVAVESGEVEFFNSAGNGIRLLPGDLGRFDKISGKFSRLQVDPNEIAYKTKKFVFRETGLSEVVTLLNEVYQTHISLDNPGLSSCSITVSFSNESIESVLGIITETLELSYIKTSDGYLIMGGKCLRD
jgi:transmembrane sensor